MTRETTVAVVGGGAAGLTAAHFLARAGIGVEVIDQDRSILKRAQLHNLPGSEVLEGRDRLTGLRAKVAAAGVATTADKVNDIAPVEGGFDVTLRDGTVLRSRYVVLATGQGTLKLPSLPLQTDEARQPYVKVNIRTDRWGATSVPGVWAAGVVAGWPSQAVVCAGSGANVAIEIATAINGEFWVDHDDSPAASEAE